MCRSSMCGAAAAPEIIDRMTNNFGIEQPLADASEAFGTANGSFYSLGSMPISAAMIIGYGDA